MPNRTSTQSFAIIPAAGASRRMEVDKLLLPWGEGRIIDAVIDAWQAAEVSAIVVVVRPGNSELIEHCRRRDVDLVIPKEPPAEMKDSVRLAIDYLDATYHPRPDDRWLLAPADMPTLSPEVITQVIRAGAEHSEEIIVPMHGGKNGHPPAFPWRLAGDVAALADNEGVNALFKRHPTRRIECGPAAIAADIDTPEQYRRQSGDHDGGERKLSS